MPTLVRGKGLSGYSHPAEETSCQLTSVQVMVGTKLDAKMGAMNLISLLCVEVSECAVGMTPQMSHICKKTVGLHFSIPCNTCCNINL